MPSAAENYILLASQVLVCCWALVETEDLNMGHQVTMQLELFTMCWLYSDHKIGKFRWVQQKSIKIRNGTSEIGLKQIPLIGHHPLRSLVNLKTRLGKGNISS